MKCENGLFHLHYICIFKNSVQYVTLEILIRSAGKLLGISSVANSFEENKTNEVPPISETKEPVYYI